VSLTGRIKRPLVSIQGTLDALTPPPRYGDVYHHMVTDAGRGELHRYRLVAGGTHTDGLVPIAVGLLRPMLPAFVEGFAELEVMARDAGGADVRGDSSRAG